MDKEAAMPELIFKQAKLDDLKDAGDNLADLISMVEHSKVVSINMKNVDLLTPAYADQLFGNAAIEFARKGAKMNFSFKNKEIGGVMSAILKESISKSLPTSFGGTATVH